MLINLENKMGLYIGGAQCTHAEFNESEDYEDFDYHERDLRKLAKKHDVSISRYSLSGGIYSFVIMNKKAVFDFFHVGNAFKYNMSVEISDSFDEKAKAFIKELKSDEQFKKFHDLNWSGPEVLYIVLS